MYTNQKLIPTFLRKIIFSNTNFNFFYMKNSLKIPHKDTKIYAQSVGAVENTDGFSAEE